MPPVAKQWHLLPHDSHTITELAQSLRISPIIAQLLINRELRDPALASAFLNAPMRGLRPPQELPGVPEAVECIMQAIHQQQRICIYGDYDVDGTSGAAILLRLFEILNIPIEFYVPNRLDEGYGLNAAALRELADRGVQLIITVDCGIASIAEAEVAKSIGLRLIITDHHEFKDRLPDVAAIVHPRKPGSNYPFGGLSGSAVAFKLAWALAVRIAGNEKVGPELRDFLLDALALASLGVVADVVPLRDENRIIVRHGLHRMTEQPTVGVRALLTASDIAEGTPVRSEHIGYRLGPRLNAAGRLGSARTVVEMLITRDAAHAERTAQWLQQQNIERQKLERDMTEAARAMVEGLPIGDLPALVLASDEWHPGVMGIVASRLVEAFARPVLMIATRDAADIAPGSGRSVPGFPLHEALQACTGALVGHGGHAAAAGFKIRPTDIERFRELFCTFAAQHFPSGSPPPPQLLIDSEIPLSAVTMGIIRDLEQLEPYGAGNHRPLFMTGDLELVGDPRRIGQEGRHLAFRVRHGLGKTLRAVAWNMGDRFEELMSGGGQCSLVYRPKINEWNGERNVEIEVVDFQPHSEAVLD